MRDYGRLAVAGDGRIAKWSSHRLGRGHYVRATGAGRLGGQCPRCRRGGQATDISGAVMESDGNIVAAGDAEGNVVLTDGEGNVLAANEKGNTIV